MPRSFTMFGKRVVALGIGLTIAGCSLFLKDDDPIVAAEFDTEATATAVEGPDTTLAFTIRVYSVTARPSCQGRQADRVVNSGPDVVVRARVRVTGDCDSMTLYYPLIHRIATKWDVPGTYQVTFIGACGDVECSRSKTVVVLPI